MVQSILVKKHIYVKMNTSEYLFFSISSTTVNSYCSKTQCGIYVRLINKQYQTEYINFR